MLIKPGTIVFERISQHDFRKTARTVAVFYTTGTGKRVPLFSYNDSDLHVQASELVDKTPADARAVLKRKILLYLERHGRRPWGHWTDDPHWEHQPGYRR